MIFGEEQTNILMIGVFPPPTHGMAVVNMGMLDRLRLAGANPLVIDVSSTNLDRRLSVRMSRFPKVLYAIVCLASRRGMRGTNLYISVSGGLGKIYEIIFALIARLRGMRLYFHHHSFSYLYKFSTLTQVLIRSTDQQSVHIVLSKKMAQRLRYIYKATNIVSISNAVFTFRNHISLIKSSKKLRTIGFISNISAQKGIFDFLDLMSTIEAWNLPLKAMLAGPFEDTNIDQAVRLQLAQIHNTEYVGPKYGEEKEDFYNHIDILVFPTRNEAEPLIILEAMSHGIPVISYAHGCIPEILTKNCGRVIDTNDNFVQIAFEQITSWFENPLKYQAASIESANRIFQIYLKNNPQLDKLVNNMMGEVSCEL